MREDLILKRVKIKQKIIIGLAIVVLFGDRGVVVLDMTNVAIFVRMMLTVIT
jgi:hypothetical protein